MPRTLSANEDDLDLFSLDEGIHAHILKWRGKTSFSFNTLELKVNHCTKLFRTRTILM